MNTHAVGPGDHVLLTGNGISLAAAVVEVLDHPAWQPPRASPGPVPDGGTGRSSAGIGRGRGHGRLCARR
ncbi:MULTISPECIES: hypothetical protein [unclassified Kitasatospora]|uniref:hypothetical protein n=1 Tax=unclassified Kitasatospora TaxID=2633591 RepID=UPI00381FA73A